MIVVLVCGGREFSDVDFLENVLDHVHRKYFVVTVIQGEARGADTLAKEWAIKRGVLHHGKEALWDKYGRSAGFRRNESMANLKPHLVVAFKGGVGTAMMVRISKERKIKVLDFRKCAAS